MLFKKILSLSLFMSLSVGALGLDDDEINKVIANLETRGIDRRRIAIIRQPSGKPLSGPADHDFESYKCSAMDPVTLAMYKKTGEFYQNEKPIIPHPNLTSQTSTEEDLESDPEEILGDNHDNVNEETEDNYMLRPD